MERGGREEEGVRKRKGEGKGRGREGEGMEGEGGEGMREERGGGRGREGGKGHVSLFYCILYIPLSFSLPRTRVQLVLKCLLSNSLR